MNLSELLHSLTDEEINYISNLDYGMEADLHKKELLKVISKNGIVDCQNTQNWHPYEVIELGSHVLQKGHEKEYTCCNAIILKKNLSLSKLK